MIHPTAIVHPGAKLGANVAVGVVARRPRVDGPIEAMVHFRIGKDGRLSALELVQPSGVAPFDLAALRAVEAASPFPPLPTSYRSDSLGVNLIVR